MRNSGPFYLAIIEKPKSKVWYKKQRTVVNIKDRLFHEKYGFGSGIACRGKKADQPFGKKNACGGLESAKKSYHRCRQQATQASVHWQTTRKVTKQSSDRSYPSSAVLSANRFRIPVTFFQCPFSTTIQRLHPAKQ